jgi:hypothetical protein
MAKDRKDVADSLSADDSDGWLGGVLADENEFDRRTFLRLGAWGLAAVGAVTLAILANQSDTHARRDQLAILDLTRQAQHLQEIARETRVENKRLASAIATLNSDRDRLFARVTTLEQGLDSVTGSIARQAAARPPDQASPKATAPSGSPVRPSAPVAAPVASVAAAPAEHISTPPPAADAAAPVPVPAASSNKPVAGNEPRTANDATVAASPTSPSAGQTGNSQAASLVAAGTPAIVASVPSKGPGEADAAPIKAPDAMSANAEIAEDEAKSVAEVAVPRTEFGVDLGGAASLEGLRALWRRVTTSSKDVADLQPVIGVREHNGKLQLRLVAGPLDDAATAARICAALAASRHACQTSVFDGQRLALNPAPPPAPRQLHHRPSAHSSRRSAAVPKPRPVTPEPAPTVERAN